MILLKLTNGNNNVNKRQKRYLLFPSSTQWGVFATISIPLHPENTVSVAWFFEANYYNVANATYFNPLLGDIGDITNDVDLKMFNCLTIDYWVLFNDYLFKLSRSRDERSVDDSLSLITRSRLYTFIESMLNKHGYPARACLLRVICENATTHFLENGLLGDLLHLMLTPSTSMSEEHIDDCYYEAEYRGLEDDCDKYTHYCPTSPMERISMYIEQLL